MKTRILVVAAVAAVASLNAPAWAVDMGRPAAAAPVVPLAVSAVQDWSGFYAGINAGWGFGRGAFGGANGGASSDSDVAGLPSFVPHPDGFIGGGQLGFNYQLGHILAGVETDIAWAHVAGDDSWIRSASDNSATATVHQELNWLGTTRARLGYAPGPALLVYATGGLAYGEVASSLNASFPPDKSISASLSETRVGWTAGLGAEWQFAPRWSVKGEWLHYDLGTSSYAAPLTGTGVNVALSSKNEGELVRVGLNYRFF